MSELSTGVKTLVARMETNPEEFFGEASKWRFMFGDKFREVMTEPEKAALHAALKEVRRKEFDALAVRTLLEDDLKQAAMGRGAIGGSYEKQSLALSTGNFGSAKLLVEGSKVSYD